VSERTAQAAGVDPPSAQILLEEVAEEVFAHFACDGHLDAQARENDGGVCRAPARR
jgi:hypothetical protein